MKLRLLSAKYSLRIILSDAHAVHMLFTSSNFYIHDLYDQLHAFISAIANWPK